MPLAKCPRCDKLFDKLPKAQFSVCPACLDDEQRDYDRIRDLINRDGSLTAIEIAEQLNIPLDVILRMINEGWIEYADESKPVYCGRCGAKAISSSKRLCEACLIKLQRECMEALRELRETLSEEAKRKKMDVKEMVEQKKMHPKEKREQDKLRVRSEPPQTPPTLSTSTRMVIQELLKKDQKKK